MNNNKIALDDFLARAEGKEKFQELLLNAKPTFDTHIEEQAPTDLIVEQAARIDSDIERARIIKLIATHLGIPVGDVRSEVAKHIHKTDEEANSNDKPEVFTEEEIAAAEALLNNPELLDLAVKQTEKAGHVGEATNKKILILAFNSRHLNKSISCTPKGQSSSGKNALVNSILPLLPKSEYFDYTAVSAKALYYCQEQDLSHKILVIYESHGSEQADYPIRSAISEDKLKMEVTIRDPRTGRMTTQKIEIPTKGMVFVETTTKETLHKENQTRVIDLNIDESREMTQAILDKMSEMAAHPIDETALEKELRIWRCAQTLLKRYEVVIPFAPELPKEFPTSKTRARRDYLRFLALIKSHALLHQYQRRTDANGHLVATVDDLRAVVPLAERAVLQSMREMTPKKQELLVVIRESFADGVQFSLSDIQKRLGELMNKYIYIKNKNINSFPNDDNNLDKKDWNLIFMLKDILRGEMPYPTIQAHIKSFLESGILEWNGERGKSSRYSLSIIPDELNINKLFLSPKFLETLEKNYIDPENINNINSFDDTSEEPKDAQEGNGAAKSEDMGTDPGGNKAEITVIPRDPGWSLRSWQRPSGSDDDTKATNGQPFKSCDGYAHPDNCDCSGCLILKKRPKGNNTITRTVQINKELIKLEYDRESETLTVRKNGETIYVGWKHETKFQEYMKHFEGGVQ